MGGRGGTHAILVGIDHMDLVVSQQWFIRAERFAGFSEVIRIYDTSC